MKEINWDKIQKIIIIVMIILVVFIIFCYTMAIITHLKCHPSK